MTTTPHDALFKSVFSQVENAAAALKPLVSEELANATDWTSLVLEPGSYIDEALTERQSDLLFRATIAGTDARYYLLFEHQSEPDTRMPFRLLRYMVRIWERLELTDSERLPAIIAVVLSHGERGWHVPTSFEDTLALGTLRENLLPYVPRFRYVVDDLAQATDDELNARISSLYVRIVMRLFRDGRRLPISLVLQQCADLLVAIGRSTSVESSLTEPTDLPHSPSSAKSPRTRIKPCATSPTDCLNRSKRKDVLKGVSKGALRGVSKVCVRRFVSFCG